MSVREYPFLVTVILTVYRTKDSAVRVARELRSTVIDERTGEIVFEPRPRKDDS